MVDIGNNRNIGVPGRQQTQLSQLESQLLSSGIARTPRQARQLAQALIQKLRQLGAQVGQQGSIDGRLKDALKFFQKQQGLPQSGSLDKQTLSKLQELGLMPKTQSPQQTEGSQNEALPRFGGEFGLGGPGSAQNADGFSKSAPQANKNFSAAQQAPLTPPPPPVPVPGQAPIEKTHTLEQRQAVERSLLTKETKPDDLNQLLNSLSQLGFKAAGKGRAKLTNALKAFQSAQSLPASGKADAQTLNALIKEGILPESTFVKSESTGAGDTAPPSGQEAARGEGNPHAVAQGQQGVSDAAQGAASEDTDYGTKDDKNNSPAGDEDESDSSRGHAQLKEGEHDEGYYEIPTLHFQVSKALQEIKRNDGEKGAMTYSWDVTFHKPGVYGARQPAQALWHIVVDRASPFDAVWNEAREKLNTRVRRIEPEFPELELSDFRQALQLARFREPEQDVLESPEGGSKLE